MHALPAHTQAIPSGRLIFSFFTYIYIYKFISELRRKKKPQHTKLHMHSIVEAPYNTPSVLFALKAI